MANKVWPHVRLPQCLNVSLAWAYVIKLTRLGNNHIYYNSSSNDSYSAKYPK